MLNQILCQDDIGAYWLPWHIDSQFITLLTCDDYFSEKSGEAAAPPELSGSGLVAMNAEGQVQINIYVYI